MNSDKILIQRYKSPFGELILGSFKKELCLCDWKFRKMRDKIDGRLKRLLNAGLYEDSSDVTSKAILQLEEYFRGERTDFSLPLKMTGTEFQKKVWRALMDIPFGKTESYFGLSKKLGSPKAIRAVASANGANSLAILIPCHRIVGSSGQLTGYAGGVLVKKKLLELEGSWQKAQPRLF